jgi:hypothetical protein
MSFSYVLVSGLERGKGAMGRREADSHQHQHINMQHVTRGVNKEGAYQSKPY